MRPLDLRREQRAARRRSLQVLVERRLERWGQPARRPLAIASISSTRRMPTDS